MKLNDEPKKKTITYPLKAFAVACIATQLICACDSGNSTNTTQNTTQNTTEPGINRGQLYTIHKNRAISLGTNSANQ